MRSGKTSPKIEDARKNRGQTPAKARLSDVRQRRLSRLCSRTGNPTCAHTGADTVMTVAADSHRASPAFGGLRPAVSQPFVFFYYTKTARICQAIASAASCGKSAPICRKAGRRAFRRKRTSARRRPGMPGRHLRRGRTVGRYPCRRPKRGCDPPARAACAAPFGLLLSAGDKL